MNLLQTLAGTPGLAALIVLLLMTAQSAPVTGFFLPGIIILPALGAVSGSGMLPYTLVFACAVAGAWLGDMLGFWLGRKGGEGRLARIFGRRQRAVQSVQNLVDRHSILSIFMARFVWFVHPVVPPALGLLGVKPRAFALVDLPAAALWVLMYTGFGHLAMGMWLRQSVRWGEVVVLLAIAAALILTGVHFMRRRHNDSKEVKGE